MDLMEVVPRRGDNPSILTPRVLKLRRLAVDYRASSIPNKDGRVIGPSLGSLARISIKRERRKGVKGWLVGGRAFCVRFDYKFKLVSLSLLRDYILRRILRPEERGGG